MKRFAILFRRLDTSAVDQALDRAERSQKDLTVRARAIGIDVACARPREALLKLVGNFYHPWRSAPQGIPPDMQALLDKMI